jgi:8-oxo-dGTP pyrophosphatase MutT (NUDIX family)
VSLAAPSALHADALALLRGWRSPDEGQERVRRTYVDHLERNPDGLFRHNYPDHITASTLVVSADRERVLLTLHAKARAWFQFGGHCEDRDVTLEDAALREAVEESGVPDLLIDPEPVQLNPHEVPFCGPRGGVRHLDVRFVATAAPTAEHTVSEESLDVAWWPVHALPNGDADLHELVRLALARLGD